MLEEDAGAAWLCVNFVSGVLRKAPANISRLTPLCASMQHLYSSVSGKKVRLASDASACPLSALLHLHCHDCGGIRLTSVLARRRSS